MFGTTVGALLMAMTAGMGIAPSGPAPAASDPPGITFSPDCYSWGPTCKTTFPRAYTKNVLGPAASGTASGLAAAAVGVCKFGGPQAVSACTAIFGTYAGASIAAISQAAAQNQCAAYTTYFTDSIAIWRTDFGPDCH